MDDSIQIEGILVRFTSSSTGNSDNSFNSGEHLKVVFTNPPSNRHNVVVRLSVVSENPDPLAEDPQERITFGTVWGDFKNGEFRWKRFQYYWESDPSRWFRVTVGNFEWGFALPNNITIFKNTEGKYNVQVYITTEWKKNDGFSEVNADHLNSISDKNEQVTVYANFPNPWAGDVLTEINQRLQGNYEPTVTDFKAVAEVEKANSVFYLTDNIGELLDAIIYTNKTKTKERADNSIKILNIISHGGEVRIEIAGSYHTVGASFALGGKIDNNTGAPSWTVSESDTITPPQIESFCDETYKWMKNSTEGRVRRDKARTKFHETAQIVLYTCHSSDDSGITLRKVSKTFNVEALGFDEAIVYKGEISGDKTRVLDRTQTKLESQDSFSSGFKHIEPLICLKKPDNPDD